MAPNVVIKGGLGNQLFQWAYAHSISPIKPFYPVRFHYGHHDKIMHLELQDIFGLCPHVLDAGQFSPAREYLCHIAEWVWSKNTFKGVSESLFGYYQEDPRADVKQVAKAPQNARVISGYFQKNGYVDASNGALMTEILPYAAKIADRLIAGKIIPSEYSVLHIRTGAYTAQSATDPSFIGNLEESFFLENLDKLGADYLIVLTENAGHIPELINKIKPNLVLDANHLNAWETLATMAASDSMIGANSSLSWWGAKLCATNGGKTWLPSNWSAWNNIDTEDYRFPTLQTIESVWRA